MQDLWLLIMSVLRFDGPAVESFVGAPGSAQLALMVVVLAGISETAGNSVVLFINRVRPVRFVLTLAVAGVMIAFTYAVWTLSVFVTARWAYSVAEPYRVTAQVVAFGYAPRVFGFFEFLPVLGRPFAALLKVWSVLAVLQGVATVLGLSPWQAFATVTGGGLLLVSFQQLFGRPLLAVAHWLQARAAGVPLVLDPEGLEKLVNAGRRPRSER